MEIRLSKEGSDFDIWKQHLKSKLNQRGFHEQYRAIKKIGQGNFAKVYKVVNIQQSTFFAAKCFSKSTLYEDKNGKNSLINEIQIMRSLKH